MDIAILLQLDLGSDNGTQTRQEILGKKERNIFSGMDQKPQTTHKNIERLDLMMDMLLIKVWRKVSEGGGVVCQRGNQKSFLKEYKKKMKNIWI